MSKDLDLDQKDKSDYKGIVKATSLFGGVQVYKILIGIIQTKFIALFLGPFGIGVQGLFQSALSIIQSISSLGLSTSAVKNIAEANGENDITKLSLISSVLKKLVWYTGILGMLLVIAFSPILSKKSFGNNEYILSFIFLSVTLLFQQQSAGQSVMLQGMRKLSYLAKSGIIGVTIGLLISIPLYYYFRIDAIVPVLIINSITTLILTTYFTSKIQIPKVKVTNKQAFKLGSEIMKMGLALSFNAILVSIVTYLIRTYISNDSGVNIVGYYIAGSTLVSTYAGLVFTSMATDFYPRLSEVNKNIEKSNDVINKQCEILLLLISPLIMSFVILVPLIIIILYTSEFNAIKSFLIVSIIGVFFKSLSWSMSMLFLAKSESKVFIISETVGYIIYFILHVALYNMYGLIGLGIAFTVYNIYYFLQTYFVVRIKYKYSFSSSLIKLSTINLLLLSIFYVLNYFCDENTSKILSIIIIVVSLIISINGLNKRIDILKIIKSKIRK